MMPSDSSDISTTQNLLSHYVGQLVQGCGNLSCHEPLCDTGRRNASPANRAVRSWNPRSARAIAIALVDGPDPRKHLCQLYEAGSQGNHETVEQSESARDPSSFEQLFSDTEAIRTLLLPNAALETSENPFRVHFDAVRPLTSTVDVTAQPCEILCNDAAADILCAAIKACLDGVPKGPIAQYAYADQWIREGHAYPNHNNQTPADARWNIWLSILDSFERPIANGLLAKICEAVAARTKLELDLDVLKHELRVESLRGRNSPDKILTILITKLESTIDLAHTFALVVWLKKVFLLHWNGAQALPASTSALGALLLLEGLHSLSAHKMLKNNKLYSLTAVANRSDAVAMADSWMQFRPDDSRGRHLLSFEFLFETKERALYFRSVNHLGMREAHNAAEKAVFLRRRVAPATIDEEPEDPVKHAEEHYLLLNVSRTNVLQDAFDQLWQRRESELFRPLRVRLGEVEEFEIGHDLGGVQIEFFNLICKEIFAEDAQMFTSSAKTGLSYFRAGSLQPLYFFELFGLLVALAIYNGVTLPTSFPLVFYKLLLDGHEGDCNGRCRAFDLADLHDGWPDDSASLKYILETEGAEADLDYLFPLEANGLRLFACGDTVSRLTGPSEANLRLTVAEAMPIAFPAPRKPDVQKLDWPGWHFEAETSGSPAPRAVDSKLDYVHKYAHWLVLGSVEPQWNAFRRGFARVLDRHTFRIFSSPEQLQSYVEGSTHLDIRELRRAARYEGFEANGDYMQTFWKVVGSWSEEKQKQLLKFVTAAERVPAGGAKDITFVIQESTVEDFGSAGEKEASLPTSSTCFGTLSLPRYSSGAVLNRKLSLAIKYGMEGFGTG